VLIVRGCRIVIDPVLGKHISGADSEGLVGLPHEVWGGNVRAWWGGSV